MTKFDVLSLFSLRNLQLASAAPLPTRPSRPPGTMSNPDLSSILLAISPQAAPSPLTPVAT